jgi:hypothetical protein
MTNSNTTKSNAKLPVFRKVLPGGISAAVFENERDGRIYRSVNLQRSYRKNGEWARMSMYLDHEHIPFFIEVLEGTWKFLNEHPAGGSAAQEAGGEPIDEQANDTYDETHVAA